MKSPLVVAAIAISTLAVGADAGEPVDEAIVARIKTEAFQHSRVMDTLSELTDVYGARLRGSPGYAAAADWVKQRLIEWGFEKVTFEPGGFPGPGWQVRRFNVEMTEPAYLHAIAQPLAWSPSTNGRVSGTPVLVEVSAPADFEKYRGKLRGAIVMNGRPRTAAATAFTPSATRFTDEELARASSSIDPDRARARELRRPRLCRGGESAAPGTRDPRRDREVLQGRRGCSGAHGQPAVLGGHYGDRRQRLRSLRPELEDSESRPGAAVVRARTRALWPHRQARRAPAPGETRAAAGRRDHPGCQKRQHHRGDAGQRSETRGRSRDARRTLRLVAYGNRRHRQRLPAAS